jgi:DNA polymerase III gamma/tau subunit
MKFNQLPKDEIVLFLNKISEHEKLNMDNKTLKNIQELFKSDIRSMINFMQTNQDIIKNKEKSKYFSMYIIDNKVWETLTDKILNKENTETLLQYINELSIHFNINKKAIIKNYANYIIRNKNKFVTKDFLDFIEYIMHLDDLYCDNNIIKELPIDHRIQFDQEVYNEDGKLLTIGVVKLYFMDKTLSKRASMPNLLMQKLSPFFTAPTL